MIPALCAVYTSVVFLTNLFSISDVSAVQAMLEEESRGVTVVNKYLPATDNSATAAASATDVTTDATPVTGGAGSDTWFEVRIDPEVYRRLEDSVRVMTEGECSLAKVDLRPYL